MQGDFVFSVRCCMNGYDTLSRKCGSGADRIAAVARLGVNPTLRVTPLKRCRSFLGAGRSEGCPDQIGAEGSLPFSSTMFLTRNNSLL